VLAGVIESFTQIVINLVFFLICLPFTYIVASELREKATSPFASSFAADEMSELTVSLAANTGTSAPGYGRLN
jgi:hypothetical protein